MGIELQLLITALFFIAFWIAGSMIFEVYVDEISKNRQSQRTKTSLVKGMRRLSEPISDLLVKIVHVPEHSRSAQVRDLERAGLDITPERHMADSIAMGIITAFVGVPLALAGFDLLALAGPVCGVLLAYSEMTKVKSRLKELDERIGMVLPSFARTITENLKLTRDLTEIFSRYLRDVPDTPLQADLTRLIARMKTGENVETALMAFDASVNVPACSSFVAALIQITKGFEQEAYMEAINAEMATLNRENMKRIMDRRPGKLKKAKVAMYLGAGMVLVIPVVLNLTQSAGGFFG